MKEMKEAAAAEAVAVAVAVAVAAVVEHAWQQKMKEMKEAAVVAAAVVAVVDAAAGEHSRQQKKEQEEHDRQRKEEHPKARSKYKTFDDQMEDLMLYKETHGHVNIFISEEKSLYKFCATARHARRNPGKSRMKKLTNEHIAAFDAIGFIWTTQE